MKWGKYFGRLVVMSLLAAIILSAIGWALGAVESLGGAWGPVLAIVLTIVLFAFAKKFNPGKETFMEYLPVVLTVIAVVAAVALIWPASPLVFMTEMSYVGFAVAFASVFFAGALAGKFIK